MSPIRGASSLPGELPAESDGHERNVLPTAHAQGKTQACPPASFAAVPASHAVACGRSVVAASSARHDRDRDDNAAPQPEFISTFDIIDALKILSGFGTLCHSDAMDRELDFLGILLVLANWGDCTTHDSVPQIVQDCFDKFGSDTAALEACLDAVAATQGGSSPCVTVPVFLALLVDESSPSLSLLP